MTDPHNAEIYEHQPCMIAKSQLFIMQVIFVFFVSFAISTALLLHAMNNITLYTNTCLLRLLLYCFLQ